MKVTFGAFLVGRKPGGLCKPNHAMWGGGGSGECEFLISDGVGEGGAIGNI